MTFGLIGLIVGAIMGLTGAGGALVSIPLFLTLEESLLREATVLSLLAVIFGTSANLIGQLKRVDLKIVIFFSLSGAISNYASLKAKSHTPDIVIAIILTMIGLYSLWGVWSKSSKEVSKTEVRPSYPKLVAVGLLLGLLTTLTGLGGGVILVPILIKFFGKTYDQALPTSLATIFFVSLTAFLFQLSTALSIVSVREILLLAGGSLISFLILKMSLKNLSVHTLGWLRKSVFTAVTIYSIGNVLWKTI